MIPMTLSHHLSQADVPAWKTTNTRHILANTPMLKVL